MIASDDNAKNVKPYRRGIIQSVDRALTLLERVWEFGRPARLEEIATGTQLDRSTVHRLLRTLVLRGYVHQDMLSKMYEPGPKVLHLARESEQGSVLMREARPRLRQLAEITGETAHLAVPAGDTVLLVDHALSKHMLGVTNTSGGIEPLTCTALGKALIWDWDEAALRTIMGRGLPQHTPLTLTDPAELLANLAEAKQRGYALDMEEYRIGIRCLAAPIQERGGRCIASIGISGPKERLPDSEIAIAGDQVRKTADEISAALGHA